MLLFSLRLLFVARIDVEFLFEFGKCPCNEGGIVEQSRGQEVGDEVKRSDYVEQRSDDEHERREVVAAISAGSDVAHVGGKHTEL